MPAACAAGSDRALGAAVDGERPGRVGAAAATREREAAHRADRRQRLAAEAEAADVQEIVVGQLRGAVALDRERQFLAAHADAVVAHHDEALAAVDERHVDAAWRRRRSRSRPAP